jgi:hypothetical protein
VARVKDSQDLWRRLKDLNPFGGKCQEHREEECRCAVSVVHLGWADRVPVVAQVTTNACCNSVSSKRLLVDHSEAFNLSVVVTTQGSQVVAGYSNRNSLPAAQECREERTESGWVISKVRRRERCRCRPVVHRCLGGNHSPVEVDEVALVEGGGVEVDSAGNTTA